VVRKDLVDSGKYKNPRDLRGMKIGVLTLGGNADFNVRRALKLGDVAADSVQITTLSFPDAVVAFSNKSLDAAFEVEPFVTIAKARGAAVLEIPQGSTSPPIPTIVLFANQSFAAAHKEAVERFVTALLRGQREFMADSSADGPGKDELIENNVECALAVQRAHIYGFNNAYVCDAAERFPDRLKALCMVDALDPEIREQVHHWVGTRGSVGIRMTEPSKGAPPDWFASDAALAAWDACAELGGSVRLHLYRWNREACLAALKPILARYPDTTIVVDHLSNIAAEEGAPDYGVDRHLLELVEHPNVCLLFSTINLGKLAARQVSAAPVLQRVVAAFGADRVMWGSDIAQSKGSYAEMLELAAHAVADLRPDERRQVLDVTARRVYWRF
jgi:L-fuconolactonase